jgi:hypothetical protein
MSAQSALIIFGPPQCDRLRQLPASRPANAAAKLPPRSAATTASGELLRFFLVLELDVPIAFEDFLQLSVALGGH